MKYTFLFLLLISSLIHADPTPSPTPEAQQTIDLSPILGGLNNVMDAIGKLPRQMADSLLGGAKEQIKKFFIQPVADFTAGIFTFIVSNPIITSPETKGIFDDIIFVVELFFMVILIWNAIRIMYSSVLGPVDRAVAKEDVKKTFFAMFVVWLSYEIYFIVIELVNAIVKLIAPSSEDWSAVMTSLTSPGSFLIFILLVIMMLSFLLWAVTRYVLVYLGLFMFPLALAFESLDATRAFGKVLKNIIIANFVVQIIDVLLFKVLIALIKSYGTFNLSLAPDVGRILLAIGVFFLIILINAVLYTTAVLESVMSNPVTSKSLMIAKMVV
jgi:hypothetical protein